MATTTFCALDFETANGSRASVCSVGLARFTLDGKLVAGGATLVRPPAGHDHFGPYNMHVHRIDPRKIREANAPGWEQVLPRLVEFISDDVVVAHNGSFERSVLAQASAAVGAQAPDVEVVCTVKLAQKMLPELKDHKLPTVAAALGVPVLEHHQAMADAVMCGLIAARLLARTAPGTTLTQLANASAGRLF